MVSHTETDLGKLKQDFGLGCLARLHHGQPAEQLSSHGPVVHVDGVSATAALRRRVADACLTSVARVVIDDSKDFLSIP